MKFKAVIPILGFENIKEYELEEVEEGFFRLKSDEVMFSLINPFLFVKDYDFEIDDETQQKLQIDENSKILVLNILTVDKKFENSLVNLAAPIILNLDKQLLAQFVIRDGKYPLSIPLKELIKD